jgi:hypothetical protein
MSDNNKYEVGFMRDDNNDIRLPGSLQPEAVMGSGPYDFAKPGSLDPKPTGGVVGTPTIDSGYGMEGSVSPSLNPNVDTKNSDTSLNTTYEHVDRSAPYAYPRVTQDAPEKGRDQFADHS